jgi:hypothetical protein
MHGLDSLMSAVTRQGLGRLHSLLALVGKSIKTECHDFTFPTSKGNETGQGFAIGDAPVPGGNGGQEKDGKTVESLTRSGR